MSIFPAFATIKATSRMTARAGFSEPYGEVFKVLMEDSSDYPYSDELANQGFARAFHRALKRVFDFAGRPTTWPLPPTKWTIDHSLGTRDRTVLQATYQVLKNKTGMDEPTFDPLDSDFNQFETITRQVLIRTSASGKNLEVIYAPIAGIDTSNVHDDAALGLLEGVSPPKTLGVDPHFISSKKDLPFYYSDDYFYIVFYDDCVSIFFPRSSDSYGRETGWVEVIHVGNVFYPVESSDDVNAFGARRPDKAIKNEYDSTYYDPFYPRTSRYKSMGDAVLLGSLDHDVKLNDTYSRWWLNRQTKTVSTNRRIPSVITPNSYTGSIIRTGKNEWTSIAGLSLSGGLNSVDRGMTHKSYYDLRHYAKNQQPINLPEPVDRLLPIPYPALSKGLMGYSKYIRTFSSPMPHGGMLVSEDPGSDQAWMCFSIASSGIPSNYVALWQKTPARVVPVPTIIMTAKASVTLDQTKITKT